MHSAARALAFKSESVFSIINKSLFELFKERVIVNFGDYFCCIYILSAKLFICSQTFVNLKYIQKLEISYEFDVRLIFTPMYGGFTDCTVFVTANFPCILSYANL